MHPAYSVIFFTSLSGAGYGLLAILAIAALAGFLPDDIAFALAAIALCLGLIVGGLLCSTLHLHHPERAWRAFSQWRSSWLSREGVVALASFVPAGVMALGWLFPESIPLVVWKLGALGALIGAIATVFCTAMIYASLKPVPQWRVTLGTLPLTPVVYFVFALAGGMAWNQTLLSCFDASLARSMFMPSCLAIALAWLAKWLYWRGIDAVAMPDLLDATGLKGDWREMHAFDLPHTERNYLQKEMGYRVGRKHRLLLRRLAWSGGGVLPVFLLLLGGWAEGIFAIVFSLLAAILLMTGTLVERWLFFAEAVHVSSLYYDNKR